MVVGLPGLLLALIVRLTLQEPPRGVSEPVRVDAGATPPIGEVFRCLWERPSFRWLSMSAGFQAFVSYGAGAWIPPMFERTHGLIEHANRHGVVLARIRRASSARSPAVGIGDRLGARDVRWYMWLPALTTLAVVPFQAFCLSDERSLARVLGDGDSEHARFVLARADVFADAGPRRACACGPSPHRSCCSC